MIRNALLSRPSDTWPNTQASHDAEARAYNKSCLSGSSPGGSLMLRRPLLRDREEAGSMVSGSRFQLPPTFGGDDNGSLPVASMTPTSTTIPVKIPDSRMSAGTGSADQWWS